MKIELQTDSQTLLNTYYLLIKKTLMYIQQGDIIKGLTQWIHIFIYWEFPISEQHPGIYICILQLLNLYIHW